MKMVQVHYYHLDAFDGKRRIGCFIERRCIYKGLVLSVRAPESGLGAKSD